MRLLETNKREVIDLPHNVVMRLARLLQQRKPFVELKGEARARKHRRTAMSTQTNFKLTSEEVL